MPTQLSMMPDVVPHSEVVGGEPLAIVAPAQLPQRMQAMHRCYGTTRGQKCGTCRRFLTKRLGGTYHKCALNRQSSGPATDWRANWLACGKWEARP
jgi:hypothetical protein